MVAQDSIATLMRLSVMSVAMPGVLLLVGIEENIGRHQIDTLNRQLHKERAETV